MDTTFKLKVKTHRGFKHSWENADPPPFEKTGMSQQCNGSSLPINWPQLSKKKHLGRKHSCLKYGTFLQHAQKTRMLFSMWIYHELSHNFHCFDAYERKDVDAFSLELGND